MKDNVYRITFDVTHCCNLKCKLCASHIPVQKNIWNPPIDELISSIDKVFELAPTIEKLVISGGEPLLRQDLSIFMDYLVKYKDRVKFRTEIITNGSQLPSLQLLEICQKFKRTDTQHGPGIYFLVDNYGPELSTKIQEIKALLVKYEIPHEIRDYYNDWHCGGWVDFGDFSQRKDDKESIKTFKKCSIPQAQSFCFRFCKGKIYACGQSMHCMDLGLFDAEYEYIDLFDDSTSIDDKRAKMLSWYDVKFFEGCRYCDGLCPDSKRYKPAEQI